MYPIRLLFNVVLCFFIVGGGSSAQQPLGYSTIHKHRNENLHYPLEVVGLVEWCTVASVLSKCR